MLWGCQAKQAQQEPILANPKPTPSRHRPHRQAAPARALPAFYRERRQGLPLLPAPPVPRRSAVAPFPVFPSLRPVLPLPPPQFSPPEHLLPASSVRRPLLRPAAAPALDRRRPPSPPWPPPEAAPPASRPSSPRSPTGSLAPADDEVAPPLSLHESAAPQQPARAATAGTQLSPQLLLFASRRSLRNDPRPRSEERRVGKECRL